MPNIVILGSLTLGDFNVSYPTRLGTYEDEHDKAYEIIKKSWYQKIDEADIIITLVGEAEYNAGEHTGKDVAYALEHEGSKRQRIILLENHDVWEKWRNK